MNIAVAVGNVLEKPADLAVLATFEEDGLPESVAGLLEPEDFRGRTGQVRLLYPRGEVAPRRLLLIGLGKKASLTADGIRQSAATAIRHVRDLQIADFTMGVAGELELDPETIGQAFAEGIELGAYRYLHYRTGLTSEQTFATTGAALIVSSANEEAVRAGVEVGLVVASGVVLARELVNRPGYAKTPAALADEAVALGERTGLNVTVFDKDELTEQGFGGILAVGQGSSNDPRFIIMEHGQPSDGSTICLVGKGLTFDSGGLSLKPPDAMETMKSDMGGAAAVFGAMQVVANLNLPLHIVGLVSSAENMPSGTAYRPGDIVKTLSGKTVEILNTDAEGRVILADGLFYAQRYEPKAIIELSTLTGAVIIALASHATGMMATDQDLADAISRAGEASAERVWQLPLWDEYRQMVKSDIADIKNMAGRPAGSITAGAFLAEFVGDYPFVHLDVAGTAWVDNPSKSYDIKGGTGIGVRLLSEYLRGYTS